MCLTTSLLRTFRIPTTVGYASMPHPTATCAPRRRQRRPHRPSTHPLQPPRRHRVHGCRSQQQHTPPRRVRPRSNTNRQCYLTPTARNPPIRGRRLLRLRFMFAYGDDASPYCSRAHWLAQRRNTRPRNGPTSPSRTREHLIRQKLRKHPRILTPPTSEQQWSSNHYKAADAKASSVSFI
jgi:hypothetical protein